MLFTILGAIIFTTGSYQLFRCTKKTNTQSKPSKAVRSKNILLSLILIALGIVIFSYKLWHVDQQNPPNRTKISISISKKDIKTSSMAAKKLQRAAIKRGATASYADSTQIENNKSTTVVKIPESISGKEKLAANIKEYSPNKMINSVTINKTINIKLNQKIKNLSSKQLLQLSKKIAGQFIRWSTQYNIPVKQIVIYNHSNKVIFQTEL